MLKKIIRPLLAVIGTLVFASNPLQAQIFTEIGDAGQTLGTAQGAGLVNGAPLSMILGTISSPTDADLFAFNITTPMTFSATTNGGTTMIDTALFLFNSSGMAIYTNDDANGGSLQSTLPAGTSFTMSLAPGLYYLGISLSGNEPVNSNGQLLFAAFIGGDSTSVRGAAAGVNPDTLADFNGLTSFPEMGAYRIDLTGASAVPEPSTMALGLAGAAAVMVIIRKRRRAGIASM